MSAWEFSDPRVVEDYVIRMAQAEGVNATMAWSIAWAESGFNPNAKNPKSSASGVFQFLDSTFRSYCINKYHLTDTMKDKNHPAIQVNCAIYMLKEEDGYKHWNSSRSFWGHALSVV